MNCYIIHIVKRLGRVGGMESYVWHLVHGLANRDLQVVVVCEQVYESPCDRIRVIEVQAAPKRPRWRSMMTFRLRADQAIKNEFQGKSVVVHSHERSLCHQVTTIHGPPIAPAKGLFSSFNKRIMAWKRMEKEELLGPSVQMILTVSTKVRDELLNRYPGVQNQKLGMAWPGVKPSNIDAKEQKRASLNDLRFLFVGREWKRKGLDIAVSIVREFRRSYPGATLTVFGPVDEELPRSIRSVGWMTIRGWSRGICWSDFDILLHPARNEPFGMVVAEARAHGLPVLMSSNVGAADHQFSNISILDLDSPVRSWSEAAKRLVLEADNISEIKWTWSDLVEQHIQIIYPQLEPVSL